MPPAQIASLATAKKIGFIVPSSNTAVETFTISILNTLKANIIPLFTRIRVLTLGTDSSTASQFNTDTFLNAAQLLADAGAGAILWNGTSGMFLGGDLAADQTLADEMTRACGVPCSTNTLATIAALEHFSIKDISIAVPYTPALTQKLDTFFTNEGYKVHSALCMDQTPPSNLDIATTPSSEISDLVRKSVVPAKTEAVLVACTNWPATPLAADLEKELGAVKVFDSIAVTAWHGLRMIGFSGANEEMKEWGSLLASL